MWWSLRQRWEALWREGCWAGTDDRHTVSRRRSGCHGCWRGRGGAKSKPELPSGCCVQSGFLRGLAASNSSGLGRPLLGVQSCTRGGRFGTESRLLLQFCRSVVSDSLRPCGLQHTRLPCPSPMPGAYSNSCPSRQWCHPTILSSVIPFSSCPQSFPASGSFQMKRCSLHQVANVLV